jgi:hypothetical protein
VDAVSSVCVNLACRQSVGAGGTGGGALLHCTYLATLQLRRAEEIAEDERNKVLTPPATPHLLMARCNMGAALL